MASIYVVLMVMSGLFFMQPEYETADENEQLLFNRIENGIYRQQERTLLDDLIQTYSLQDHQKGLNMIFNALELAIEQDIDTLRFDCHRSLGLIYSQTGIADRSLEHSLLAKHFYERIGDSGNFNWALVNIGNTYYWLDMPDLALRYYTDARKGFEQMTRAIGHDDENERTRRTGIDGLAISLNNIALCHVKKENYLKAVDNHEKAYEFRKQMDSPILEAQSYSYIGHLYSLMGDDDKAIKYYSAALQILTDPASVDDSDIPLHSSILAFTYRRMGMYMKRKTNNQLEMMNRDMHSVINHNMEGLSLMANNKNLSFVSSLPENIYAYADVNMVNTILRNLISNAIKYSHKGGKIFKTLKNYDSK